MALRTGAPVLVGWCHRRGSRHVFHFERCDIERSDDHDADVVRLTAKLNERLEFGIRQAPEQWVWLHDRWKKQPEQTGGTDATLDLNTAPPP
jgi:KDO2-lipid IV(A) lauroyltransferase